MPPATTAEPGRPCSRRRREHRHHAAQHTSAVRRCGPRPPGSADRSMPDTAAGWVMMLLSGGTLSGAGPCPAPPPLTETVERPNRLCAPERKTCSRSCCLPGEAASFTWALANTSTRAPANTRPRASSNVPSPILPKPAPPPALLPFLPFASGDTVAKLRIPRLDAELYVVEGDGPRELRRGPGHLAGTAMPGERRQLRHRRPPRHPLPRPQRHPRRRRYRAADRKRTISLPRPPHRGRFARKHQRAPAHLARPR